MAERVGFPAALILMGVSTGSYCKFPFLQCYWQIVALVRVAVTVADRDSEVNQKIYSDFSFFLISQYPRSYKRQPSITNISRNSSALWYLASSPSGLT